MREFTSARTRSDPEVIDALVAARSLVRRDSLNERAPLRVSARLAVTAAVFVSQVVLSLVHPGWLSWVVIWIVVPPALLSCAAITHEAVHRHLYGSDAVTHAVGLAASLPLGISYAMYRASHLEHHRHTHGPGDPEPLDLLTKPWQLVLGIPALSVAFLHTLWSGNVATLFGRPPGYVKRSDLPVAVASFVAQLLVLGALGLVALRAGWVVLLAGFVVPWLLGAAVWLSILGLAEHYEMPWGPAPAIETTRSVESNAIVRLAYWNTNYHCEHHMVPSVPCWNLRKVHDHIAEEVTTSRGYLPYLGGLHGRLSRGEIPEPAPPGRDGSGNTEAGSRIGTSVSFPPGPSPTEPRGER